MKRTKTIRDFDFYIHLEPDYVYVFDESKIPSYIFSLWKNGEKIVYFANFKKDIARLTTYLVEQGVPLDDLGFSFNYSAKDKELFVKKIADSLEEKINEINTSMTADELVPDKTKILFTTSKNKEGINILNDDIKTIIAETHNKSDLIQIAGRVRGNPTSGTGIHRLVIVGDADQHNQYPNEFLYTWNKHIAVALTATFKECTSKKIGAISNPHALLEKLRQYNSDDTDAYKYIRFDYIGENYSVYEGCIESERQSNRDILEFKEIANNSVLRKDSAGQFIVFSGREILEQEWFRWSKVYFLPQKETTENEKLLSL